MFVKYATFYSSKESTVTAKNILVSELQPLFHKAISIVITAINSMLSNHCRYVFINDVIKVIKRSIYTTVLLCNRLYEIYVKRTGKTSPLPQLLSKSFSEIYILLCHCYAHKRQF